MKTARTRIARSVADATLNKGASKAYARQVAAYLLSEGRVDELDSLLRDVQSMWAEQGYVEVVARSAFPLDASLKADIEARVRTIYPDAKTIVVSEVADQSVIGGVQLSVAGTQQLDLSVQAKLNQFKRLTGAGKE
jgi:F0F1-type ATP synthase delta subunit